MRVLNVRDTVKVSDKNGRSYHNCTLVCGVPQIYEGVETLTRINVRLTSSCVEDTIRYYNLRSIEDLKGKSVRCFREAPIYLSNFEKQYNVVLCDVLQVVNNER